MYNEDHMAMSRYGNSVVVGQAAVREKVWREAIKETVTHPDEDRISFTRQELRDLWESILNDSRHVSGLRELVRDAGVDDIDPRLDYVMLQVSRNVWEDIAKLLPSDST